MIGSVALRRIAAVGGCWLMVPIVVGPSAAQQPVQYQRVAATAEQPHEMILIAPNATRVADSQTATTVPVRLRQPEPADGQLFIATPQADATPDVPAPQEPTTDAQLPSENPQRTADIEPDPPRLLQEPDEAVVAELPNANLLALGDRHPIDLATAMRLAGASNVQIALAAERVCESQARLKGAKALWLPSLVVGAGFNHHDGKVQDTEGDILDVNRGNVFVGGGVTSVPLAGGTNGPPRMFIGVSLTDALFEPLAARQRVRAAESARSSTFNDVLFQVSVAYLELSRAQTLLAIALESVSHAEEFLRLTDAQAQADVGLPADVARAQDELGKRRRQVLAAHERIGVSSAELARLLRLDPSVMLVAVEERPVPLDLIDPGSPLCDLIAQGLAMRPERSEAAANVQAAYERKRQESLRHVLPDIQVGYSAGGFAGGKGSFIGDYGGRGDFDVLAVWEIRNLGVGNAALREGANSQYRQAHIAQAGVHDRVAAEISAYYHRVRSRREQIEVSRQRVEATAKALPLNFRGIVGRQLRAIEAQQAIVALNSATTDYLDAIIQYNQAQLGLLRSIGGPPTSCSVPGGACYQ